MTTWIRKYRLLLAILALFPAYMALEISELRWGIPAQARMNAIRDYDRGVLVMQSHGLVESPGFRYRQLLRERYKVVLISGGCLQYLPDAIYDDNYNEKLSALINKRYGRDIFQECERDAAKDTRPFFK